jgi:hypothetical protein
MLYTYICAYILLYCIHTHIIFWLMTEMCFVPFLKLYLSKVTGPMLYVLRSELNALVTFRAIWNSKVCKFLSKFFNYGFSTCTHICDCGLCFWTTMLFILTRVMLDEKYWCGHWLNEMAQECALGCGI